MMMSPDLRVLLKTERTYDQTVTLVLESLSDKKGLVVFRLAHGGRRGKMPF